MYNQIKSSAGIRVSRQLAPIGLDEPRKINHLRNLDAPEPSPCASELSKSGLTQRAYSLGEADLQTLLLVRRQSLDTVSAAASARADALRARYRLLIDAHLIWGLSDD